MVLECQDTGVSASEAQEAQLDATTLATLRGAIVDAASAVSCTGTVTVPPLDATMDTMQTITCSLDVEPTTTCEFRLFVGPHPVLECPAPPDGPLLAAAAITAVEAFSSDPSVTCTPSSLADIPAIAFRTQAGADAVPYTVMCESTETPNTCDFEVMLAPSAPLPLNAAVFWDCRITPWFSKPYRYSAYHSVLRKTMPVLPSQFRRACLQATHFCVASFATKRFRTLPQQDFIDSARILGVRSSLASFLGVSSSLNFHNMLCSERA